jgi:quercetin dioxygenase-like cupin family protein
MKTWYIKPSSGRVIDRFQSKGARIQSILRDPHRWQVSLLRLEPGGVLGLHPASSDQLLLVIAGSGTVRTGEGESAQAGVDTLVFWIDGEEHETRAGPGGMAALIIEGEDLRSALINLDL